MRGGTDTQIDASLHFMQAVGTKSTGQVLVNGGMPPFLAHISAQKIKLEHLADEMSWEDFASGDAAAWIDPIAALDQIIQGEVEPTLNFVVNFCMALNITPNELVPEDHPYPAHPAFIEAAVYLKRCHLCDEDENKRIIDFLSDEVDKAHELGTDTLAPNPATNETILHTIETFYERQIEKQVQLGLLSEDEYHRAMNDDLPENMRAKWGAAIEVCAKQIGKVIARLSKGQDAALENHLLDAINKQQNFDLWRNDPSTEMFLQATANMLHITSRVPMEELHVNALPKAEMRHSRPAARP